MLKPLPSTEQLCTGVPSFPSPAPIDHDVHEPARIYSCGHPDVSIRRLHEPLLALPRMTSNVPSLGEQMRDLHEVRPYYIHILCNSNW